MRRLALLALAAIAAMGQNTAKFPGATVTLQDLLVAKDAPSRSYLTAGIDAATLSIPVADGTRFTTFQVITAADTGEQILVCSIASNTLNVCPGGRGFSGTAAAAHGIGVGVIANVVAWHHNQLAAEIKAIEEALGPNLENLPSSYTHDSSWSWVDLFLPLPVGVMVTGVFTPRTAQATITEVWCRADSSDAVIQLRRSDGNDMIPGNLACGESGSASTTLNSYAVIPVGYSVGMYEVNGSAKQIQVAIKYSSAQ